MADIDDIEPHTDDACPHCPDGHPEPNTRPWTVWVTESRSDGQPPYLMAAPTDGAHVAESDAEWLRQVIREMRARRYPGADNGARFAKEILVERDKRGAPRIVVDGELLPWATCGIETPAPNLTEAPTVTITVLAEKVTMVNDWNQART